MDIFYFVIIGAIAGLLGGLLGIGGGLFIVPLLSFIFLNNAFPQEEIPRIAVSTSQAIIVFVSLSAVYAQYKNNMLSLHSFLACLPAILAGTLIGGLAILFAPALLLKLVFFLAILVSMFILFFSIRGKKERAITTLTVFFPILCISAISSSAGIGGGGLFTAYFSFLHLPIAQSIALSMSLVVPMSLTTAVYASFGTSVVPNTLGFIYLPALFSMIVPAILFAPFGVTLRQYVPQAILRKILAVILLITGVYTIYKAV